MPLVRWPAYASRLLVPIGIVLVAPPATADPSKAECIAASEQAQIGRRAGKLRDARTKLVICVSESCPGPVREDCAALLAEVDRVMPTLVLEAKDSDGNDVSARVTVDGALFAEKLDGTSIPIDPGEHRFTFEAEGLLKTEKTLIIHEGEKGRRERVSFAPRVGSVTSSREAAMAKGSVARGGSGELQRTMGLAVGAAGLTGTVIGGVFGVLAKVTWDGAHPECQPNCSPQSVQDSHTAGSQAGVSTVAFALGAALLATGAVVYFTAPRPRDVALAPTVIGGGAGLDIRGFW